MCILTRIWQQEISTWHSLISMWLILVTLVNIGNIPVQCDDSSENENYLYRELSKLCAHYSNIAMAKNRYRTTWGATTLLTAELDVYKQLIEDLKWNFSFVITLSESDFPTKPIEVLSEFLSMFPNQNFVSGNIPNIFNRDFIQYVAYGDDELIRGLRFAFNYTAMPCESFYHTVLINSIYCDSHVRMNLRMVNWDRRRGCTCYNMDVSDLCGCSPLIYRITDKRKFAEAAGELLFFARKFDPTVDEKIIDWIDEKISGLNLSEG
ncbi:unnamed protein product, partial [Rotaria sp. Silwood2]